MSQNRENPSSGHLPPPNTSKETIDALGKLSEALEVVEDARGSLYRFHRLTGRADLALGEAVDMFKEAGYEDIARKLQDTMVGRNVLKDDGPSRSWRNTTMGTTKISRLWKKRFANSSSRVVVTFLRRK